jgi:hypothetical protein
VDPREVAVIARTIHCRRYTNAPWTRTTHRSVRPRAPHFVALIRQRSVHKNNTHTSPTVMLDCCPFRCCVCLQAYIAKPRSKNTRNEFADSFISHVTTTAILLVSHTSEQMSSRYTCPMHTVARPPARQSRSCRISYVTPPPSSLPPPPHIHTRLEHAHTHTRTHTHTCAHRFLGASARGWVQTIILIANRLANVTTRSPRSLSACARSGSGGGGGDDDGVGCEALPPLPHEMWAAILSFLRHRDIWPTPGFDTDCSVPLETIGVRLAGKQYVPPNTHKHTQHTTHTFSSLKTWLASSL